MAGRFGTPEARPTERVGFRLDLDDIERLKALVAAEKVTASDIIRNLIRRSHAERFPSKPARRSR